MRGPTSSRREVADPVERLALRTSHPVWIAKALRAALIGHGTAGPADVEESLTALLESDNAAVKVVARGASRARPRSKSKETSGAERSGLSPVGATGCPRGPRGHSGGPRRARGRAGRGLRSCSSSRLAAAGVEGEAAQHERWLDLCAGPRG